ncbi:hypothetical protein NQZ68_014459 [Dissostichus eleginoides]|nr:hypothetical protein NQZ68_014459 [Dissostichus eleginoides]
MEKWTGGPVRKPEKSGSHPHSTARLAGVPSHSVASLHKPGFRLSSTAGKCTPRMIDDYSLIASPPVHAKEGKNRLKHGLEYGDEVIVSVPD